MERVRGTLPHYLAFLTPRLQQRDKLELGHMSAEEVLGSGSSLGNTSEGGIFLPGHHQGRQ